MADEPNNPTQADGANKADQEPQEGAGGAQDGDAEDQQPKAEGNDPEIKKLRHESAGYRKRAQAAEAELKKFQDAQKTDLEKAQSQLEELQKSNAALKREVVNSKVERQAQALGFADPQLATRLVAGDLEFDDDGAPTNAKELLEAILAKHPGLKADGGSTPGGGNPAGGASKANADQKRKATLDMIPFLKTRVKE